MAGWIKLQRDIMDHWIAQDNEYLAVWVRMLAEANFNDRKTVINGALVEVKRGQLVFGLDSYSEKTGVSVRRLRKLLELLESDRMIDRQKSNKFSLISIVNYAKHQDDDRQKAGESQASDKHKSGEGQAEGSTIISKELKEGKELKKKDLCQTSDDAEKVFDYWCSVMKKNGNAKFTDERRKVIKARMKDGYTIQHIMQAIDGCARSDWHMARDGKNKTVYDDLTLICRTGSDLERFAMNINAGGSLKQLTDGYMEFMNEQH